MPIGRLSALAAPCFLLGLVASQPAHAWSRQYDGCSRVMRDDLDLVDTADALMAALAVDYMAGEVVALPEPYLMFFGPWAADRSNTVESVVNRIFVEKDEIRYDCWGVRPECERAWAATDLNTHTIYLCGGFWTDAVFEDPVRLGDQRTTVLHELSHHAGTVNVVDSLDLDVPALGWIDVSALAQVHPAMAVTWAESYEYFHARLLQVKRARPHDPGCDCHVGSARGPGGSVVFSLLCGTILLAHRRTAPMRRARMLLVAGAIAAAMVGAVLAVRGTAARTGGPVKTPPPAVAPGMDDPAREIAVTAPPVTTTTPIAGAAGASTPPVASTVGAMTKNLVWPADKPWPAWLPKPPAGIVDAAQDGDPAAGTILARPVDVGLRGRLSVAGKPSARELRVRLEVTNTGARPLMISVAGTLFDSPSFKGVAVTGADGRALPWVHDQSQVRRSPAGASDYLAIAPGETVAAERDLARYWKLPPAGRVHIAGRDWLADAYEGTGFDAHRQPWHTKVTLPVTALDVTLED